MGFKEMMEIQPNIKEFIVDLERHAKRKLMYPDELAMLLQAVSQTGMNTEFEHILFASKFLIKAGDIMNRIGPKGEGYGKLASEYEETIKDAVALLGKIAHRMPEDDHTLFTEKFLIIDQKSYRQCIELFSDLSLVKNWVIDGRSLPFDIVELSSSKSNGYPALLTGGIKRIRSVAIVALLMLALLFLLDPPVTILGWIIGLGIMISLLYILMQNRLMIRN